MGSDKNIFDKLTKVFAEINPNLFDEMCSKKLLQNEKFLYLVKNEDGDAFKSYNFVDTTISSFLVIFIATNTSLNDALLKLTNSYQII